MVDKILSHSRNWKIGKHWATARSGTKATLVLALISLGLADALLWSPRWGLGFVIWTIVTAAAVHLTLAVPFKQAVGPWTILLLALLPAVDLVQALSVFIAIFGLLGFSTLMLWTCWDVTAILRAMLRLPWFGALQVIRDALKVRLAIPLQSRVAGFVSDWALPLGVGAVFIALFAAANPILDHWLESVGRWEFNFDVSVGRVIFWVLMIFVIWPFLRLNEMRAGLERPAKARRIIGSGGLMNARAVLRALVLFNLVFALQSLMDIGYLWGGIALPEGMTYATYAHRGAYPLLATALLAGVFALLAHPFLDGSPVMRTLLLLWIAQTVLLVISAILRLDLYVSIYGLTRLRFAAFVWMILVALGLGLLLMQIFARRSVGWFGLRAACLSMATLYICALINIDGLTARQILASDRIDYYYVCSLSEGALPAIVENAAICPSSTPYVTPPVDWREWGYRNLRVRRSLAREVQE